MFRPTERRTGLLAAASAHLAFGAAVLGAVCSVNPAAAQEKATARKETPPTVPFWHVWTDEKGVSHQKRDEMSGFEFQSISPGAAPSWIDRQSTPGNHVVILYLPVGWVGEWHENPKPQWIVPLSGRWFVETMDGKRVEMGPGEVSFGGDQNTRPDAQGRKGHRSGTVGDRPAVTMLVQLERDPFVRGKDAAPSARKSPIESLVPGHGAIVPLPRAAEQPRKGARAVFDISANAKPGEVNNGLEHVARLLNLYGAAGMNAGDVQIAAVCHGAADKAVLNDAAYLSRFKVAANPNLPLIRDLKKAGVELLVCGQSLHDLGYKAEEVTEEVAIADAAMLVLINKQADGYAYVPAR